MSEFLKPLYTLTIGEFMELNRQAIQTVLSENKSEPALPQDKEETFSIRECARFLGCTTCSIHNYKKRGLPYYRIGRKVLFKKSEVLEFMKSTKRKSGNKL